ncbi:MAG: hypothetical protein AAB556_00415 [Patescibacteria group bacterium]
MTLAIGRDGIVHVVNVVRSEDVATGIEKDPETMSALREEITER